jgi:hypothetical protein
VSVAQYYFGRILLSNNFEKKIVTLSWTGLILLGLICLDENVVPSA